MSKNVGKVRYKHQNGESYDRALTVEVSNGQVWLTRSVENGTGNRTVVDCVGFPPNAINSVINLLKSAAIVLGETE